MLASMVSRLPLCWAVASGTDIPFVGRARVGESVKPVDQVTRIASPIGLELERVVCSGVLDYLLFFARETTEIRERARVIHDPVEFGKHQQDRLFHPERDPFDSAINKRAGRE